MKTSQIRKIISLNSLIYVLQEHTHSDMIFFHTLRFLHKIQFKGNSFCTVRYIMYSTVQWIYYIFNCTVDILSIQLYSGYMIYSTVQFDISCIQLYSGYLSIQLYSSIYHVFNCTVDIYLFNCTVDILCIQLYSGYIIYSTVHWIYYLFNCSVDILSI